MDSNKNLEHFFKWIPDNIYRFLHRLIQPHRHHFLPLHCHHWGNFRIPSSQNFAYFWVIIWSQWLLQASIDLKFFSLRVFSLTVTFVSIRKSTCLNSTSDITEGDSNTQCFSNTTIIFFFLVAAFGGVNSGSFHSPPQNLFWSILFKNHVFIVCNSFQKYVVFVILE